MDIPRDAFTVNNKTYSVPCIFQIWKKQSTKRETINKLKANETLFSFIKKPIIETTIETTTQNIKQPDISFRRVGVNAEK